MFFIVCFADIVFCIFLYQRYIYPVDHSRFNEFGTSGEMADGTPVENGAANEGPAESIEDSPPAEPKAPELKKTD